MLQGRAACLGNTRDLKWAGNPDHADSGDVDEAWPDNYYMRLQLKTPSLFQTLQLILGLDARTGLKIKSKHVTIIALSELRDLCVSSIPE